MEEKKNLRKELRRIEDVVDTIEKKLHNTAGIIELMRLGMERLYQEDDLYEISAMSVLEEYLLSMKHTEITKIQNILTEIKEHL
ncbi:MAG: hypothetical protein HFI51_08975 [Lachnospiraceae bacterium]|nr:hypothetical protein [Lachnospiraceae bacterium]